MYGGYFAIGYDEYRQNITVVIKNQEPSKTNSRCVVRCTNSRCVVN